ncbi:hypothetical protein Moror_11766 [Moniliophthora roreri MCA 2997]|uniref:ZZ-type domain-containing protein n=1 Tax=Moniliophthora roreri (strain MCA 2997) TaxID=1381753 RepID=V2W846_MONRO|nr:hypothetical protein Moror_11766 [Moniliophthora roreri MCA 2997]
MALRDHFAEGSQAAALAAIRDITASSKKDQDSAAQTVEEIAEIARRAGSISAEDRWALQYITIQRLQPLTEALDDDVSSFVTITEVNTFTTARPLSWSLSHWTAYWAYGFEMTVQWYFRRIRKLFADIFAASKQALPANRQIIAKFISSWAAKRVEDLLSGLRAVDEWDDINWDSDATFSKFKDYIIKSEMNMDRSLRTVNYYIDAANTLSMVTGAGRPEKYILPILFLLFQRSLTIVTQAQTATLHINELEVIQYSIITVMEGVEHRVRTLQAVYRLQNLNEKEQLRKFFYGLYSFVTEEPVMGPYWTRNPLIDTNTVFAITYPKSTDEGANFEAGKIQSLLFGPQTEELELLSNPSPEGDSQGHEATLPQSLVGHWSGSYTYNSGRNNDGLVSFTVSSHDTEGNISGSGMDSLGPFTVKGTLNGNRVMFLKAYQIPQSGQEVVWRYGGTITQDLNEITGVWGPPYANLDSLETDDPDSGQEARSDAGSFESTDIIGGHFFLKRRPIEYLLSCPTNEEFAQNRPRALWKLALDVTIRSLRSRNLSWRVLSARRRQRQRYIELVKVQEKSGCIDPKDMKDWSKLLETTHPNDLALWRAIALFQMRREVIHGPSLECDSCHNRIFAPTRLHCVSCSEGEVYGTLDLCMDCFTDNKPVTRRDDKSHSPSHNIVQMRSVAWGSYRIPMLIRGNDILNFAAVYLPSPLELNSSQGMADGDLSPLEQGLRLRCVECSKIILARPYWCCLDCKNMTLVCYECNRRIEQEKPWLYERHANTGDEHDWSHTLVSAPAPLEQGEATAEAMESLETRLEHLEDKLEKQAADVNGRLDKQAVDINERLAKLEELLSRLGSLQ